MTRARLPGGGRGHGGHCGLELGTLRWHRTISIIYCPRSNDEVLDLLLGRTYPLLATFPTIWSLDHSVIWSFDHLIIWSFGHLVIRSFGHSVIWSFGH